MLFTGSDQDKCRFRPNLMQAHIYRRRRGLGLDFERNFCTRSLAKTLQSPWRSQAEQM